MLMSSTGPGRSTSLQQREVDVREGETSIVDFVTREILVAGHVTHNGAPAPNMRLRVFGRSGGTVYMSSGVTGDTVPAPSSGPRHMAGLTRDDGGFELIVDVPGEFRALVASVDDRLRFPSRNVTIPDADRYDLELVFSGAPVSGVVVDRETRQPVGQANVSAVATRPPPTGSGGQADAEGRFQLALEAGDYRVKARAEGYAEGATNVSVPAEGLSDIRLELSKGLSLSGKVLDQRGQPLPGISVEAATEGSEASRSWGFGETLTDGSYRMDGLLNKPYNLCAGSALAGFAVRAGVSPGTQDVVLTLGPAGRVRLRALGPDGGPVAGAYPAIRRLDGAAIAVPLNRQVPTDAQGFADVFAPVGRAEVEVGTPRLKGGVTVDIRLEGGPAVNVTLREEPGATR
jgi:hypothetical protein